MRLAVVSDIHANLPALEAVLDDIAARSADAVINLGDCVSGPLWPRETMELLEARSFPTVRGIHDRFLRDRPVERLGAGGDHGIAGMARGGDGWVGAMTVGGCFLRAHTTVTAVPPCPSVAVANPSP